MVKVTEIPITHSINSYFEEKCEVEDQQQSGRLTKSRYRSRCDSTHTIPNNITHSKKYNMGGSNINILAPSFQDNNTNKKRHRKIEIPEKYKQTFEDLKNDRC